MKLLLGLIFAGAAFAQTGTVTITQPVPPTGGAPGNFTAIAGMITCNVKGNAIQVTAVTIQCNIGGTLIPTYTIPIPNGQKYVSQHTLNADSVTFTFTGTPTGIQWSATANGSTCNGSVCAGNF